MQIMFYSTTTSRQPINCFETFLQSILNFTLFSFVRIKELKIVYNFALFAKDIRHPDRIIVENVIYFIILMPIVNIIDSFYLLKKQVENASRKWIIIARG